jgi:hypothetical protein
VTEMDPLFRLLIERTRTLATVCDNAAAVLSEEFESMITGPLAEVQAVLAKCPQFMPWDGVWKDDDIIVEVFRHEAQRVDIPPASVRVIHGPTGLAVESYSKSTREENEAVARRALADRVRYKWESEQQPSQGAAMGPRPARAGKTRP